MMQQIPQEPLVLGSGSPRRRDLLQRLELDFEVQTAEGDGPAVSDAPDLRVIGHAVYKAQRVALQKPSRWILAADTLVYGEQCFFPKPKDVLDAHEMLMKLQEMKEHDVWTGACLFAPDGRKWTRADCARVEFSPIPVEEVEKYLAGEEWKDKAGAYAIQGWAEKYASLRSGELDTVIGLAGITVLDLFRQAALPNQAFRR